MMVITSGDQNVVGLVQKVFSQAGFPLDAMNVDIIGNTSAMGLQPLGLGIGHTIWSFLYRIALCQNTTACTAYQNELDEWGVLRVTPNKRKSALPFPLPALRPRDESTNESALNASLTALVHAVTAHYSTIAPLQSEDPLLPLIIEGRTCIAELTNCIGATRDAAYIDGDEPLLLATMAEESSLVRRLRASSPVPLSPLSRVGTPLLNPHGPSYILSDDPLDFIVVCGVIHSLYNGEATYSNLAVYDVDKQMGVGAVIDEQEQGSAFPFLNSTDAQFLYVQMWKRNCTGETHCFEVPTKFPGVPLKKKLSFTERAYLQPVSKVGPDPQLLLPPVVMHFFQKGI